MGKELYNYFTKAEEVGGIKARTRLSMLTKTSSLQAKFIDDSKEKSESFHNAFEKILKEFKGVSEKLPSRSNDQESDIEAIDRLREFFKIIVDFSVKRTIYVDDLESSFKTITESIAYAINCERVSIWLFDKDKNGITCANLFIKSKKKHSNHKFLAKKDYPNYFEAIESERTVPVNDAHKDSRTKEFLNDYLKPHGIASMLDIPIWVKGKLVGVMCNEQVGDKRKWTSDEENFVYLMSCFVSMAIENDTF